MVTKKDYLIGAVVGFLTGILALFIFLNLRVNFSYEILALLIGIPILFALGVWLGGFLGRWMPFFNQFGKYAAAGFLSTAIDFGILNLASYLTGVTAGATVGWINVPGFLVSVFNGYLWNKLWVFRKPEFIPSKSSLFGDFPKFILVAAIGLLLNSGIIILLTTYVPHTIAPERWLNVAKVAASAVVLIWNFVGFKFIAFRDIK